MDNHSIICTSYNLCAQRDGGPHQSYIPKAGAPLLVCGHGAPIVVYGQTVWAPPVVFTQSGVATCCVCRGGQCLFMWPGGHPLLYVPRVDGTTSCMYHGGHRLLCVLRGTVLVVCGQGLPLAVCAQG